MMDKENKLDPEALELQKDYQALKHSAGNFRCRRCLIVDGYSLEERKCRWCGEQLFELDKI